MWTCLHLFAGIGGCTLGFKRAGLLSLGSIDIDAKAIEQLRRMTGGSPAFVRDIATMQPGDLAGLVPESPDVVVMSPPCKSFSGCMPAARAAEDRYVDMSQLAVRATFLAIEAWKARPPGYILIENVPRIRTRGAPMLAQIVALLQRSGYATDQRVHDCGELGGLAQHRERFLLMARNMERCPAFLRRPPPRRVRNVGEVLLPLPSPVADHGDPNHRLPLLSPLNWVRLALIPPGKDWRALPDAVRIGSAGPAEDRHAGKLGVEDPEAPAHTVIGRGSRPGSTWASVADPRVAWDHSTHGGRPDSYGVGSMGEPSLTIRGRSETQTSRSSVADPRLADRPGRQNGGFGVEDAESPAHSVLAEGTTRNTRSSIADPRLGCEQRSGSYGVLAGDQPGPTIVGHHAHDNSPGSLADPRLANEPRRGTFGVVGLDQPSPAIRGHHAPRSAPAAVVDDRGWPLPTHEMVLEDDGVWTLYGPAVDLESKRACLMVIRVNGKWHRPLTLREKFTLQSGPVQFVIGGPTSSSKTQAGASEWVGNMIPVDAAEAVGLELIEALESSTPATFLKGPDVWVRQPAAAMEAAQA